jgi:hypothetical protein
LRHPHVGVAQKACASRSCEKRANEVCCSGGVEA